MESGTTLQANGTAAAPIVFSSTDDGEDGSGEWGGIVVESYMASTTQHRLSYFVIAEAGAPISGILSGSDIEANLALVGQHEDTRVEFFQSHSSAGDGIVLLSEDADEVNNTLLESILVTSATGDGVRFNNYSGLIKSLLVINDPATGLAGIRAGGINSNPLILNVTLVGNDDISQVGSTTEVPLAFDNDFGTGAGDVGIQMANSLLLNYRGPCYIATGGADLSGVENLIDVVSGDFVETDTEFFDGVHCVTELDLNGTLIPPPSGSPNLPSELQGAGPIQEGLSFYSGPILGGLAEFDNAVETPGWFLNNIAGNVNGSGLRLLNNGDTNGDDVVDVDDESFGPLFGRDGIFEGLGQAAIDEGFACDAPSQLPAGTRFFLDVEQTMEVTIDSSNEDLFRCYYVRVPAQFSAFNLTIIGAVESATDDRFDDWTLEGTI